VDVGGDFSGTGGVVTSGGACEVLVQTGGGLLVDGDDGSRCGGAGHVDDALILLVGVLVEEVGRVGFASSVGVGFRSVADGIEGVAELVTGDGGAVGAFFSPAGHLAVLVVGVVPIGGVFPLGLGSAPQGVVGVGVTGEDDCVFVGVDNAREASVTVEGLGGRQDQVAVLLRGGGGDGGQWLVPAVGPLVIALDQGFEATGGAGVGVGQGVGLEGCSKGGSTVLGIVGPGYRPAQRGVCFGGELVAASVGEGAGAAAVGHGSAATLLVVGDGAHIRGGIAVVDRGEVSGGVVSVAWAFVGVVKVAHQPVALGIVVPRGGGVACGTKASAVRGAQMVNRSLPPGFR